MLFMFYPFRNENELCINGSYMTKLNELGVTDIVNVKKQKFEPYSELVDTALQTFRNDMTHNQDSSAQQENDEVHEAANDLDEDSEYGEETELFTEKKG